METNLATKLQCTEYSSPSMDITVGHHLWIKCMFLYNLHTESTLHITGDVHAVKSSLTPRYFFYIKFLSVRQILCKNISVTGAVQTNHFTFKSVIWHLRWSSCNESSTLLDIFKWTNKSVCSSNIVVKYLLSQQNNVTAAFCCSNVILLKFERVPFFKHNQLQKTKTCSKSEM